MIEFNPEKPLIMYVDLNSCFATIEQQARPHLRNKPVAVVNRATENTSIVTASYEAKAYGIKVGMKLKEAKQILPSLVAIESDPLKYHFVYHRLLDIMNDYSAHIVMKSIDEGSIDFHESPDHGKNLNLENIGLEIKQRLKSEIGSAMRCNIGIGPNRFYAKLAAELHKPDGMDVIDSSNYQAVLRNLKLVDLTGIAKSNFERLKAVNILTPLDFLNATSETLTRMVFKSILGKQWFQKLRGYEVDDRVSQTKQVGRQYVMEKYGLSLDDIFKRLHNLCESIGQRLRQQNLQARGVYVYIKDYNNHYWHNCQVVEVPFDQNEIVYNLAKNLMKNTTYFPIKEIGLHCYLLQNNKTVQPTLFDNLNKKSDLNKAIDEINSRYGSRTIHSADTLSTNNYVKDKIPFGSTRYL